MKWDENKADLWMDTVNPLLGGVSPNFMIATHRGAKLRKWVDALIKGNWP